MTFRIIADAEFEADDIDDAFTFLEFYFADLSSDISMQRVELNKGFIAIKPKYDNKSFNHIKT